MKISNQDIKLAHDGAQALAAADLPFPVAMKLYDAIEVLAPKAEAVERERIKLIQKYGEKNREGEISVKQGGPGWQEFESAYLELIGIEQEVGALPVIFVSELGTAEAMQKLPAKAQLIGALRRVGVLAMGAPPAPRAERRRAAKEESKGRAKLKAS